MIHNQKKRIADLRGIYRRSLFAVVIVSVMAYLLLDIRYALFIIFAASSSLLSLKLYLRRLEKEEVQEKKTQESTLT